MKKGKHMVKNRRYLFSMVLYLGTLVLTATTIRAEKVVVIPLMGATNNGASIAWAGEWQDDFQYVIGDGMQFNGSSYICIKDHLSSSSNVPPNAKYWSLMAKKGDTGEQGLGISDFMCDIGEYIIGFKDNVPVCSQVITCKAAESDANAIAASLGDYFAIPIHTTLGAPIVLDPAGGAPESGGVSDMTFPALSENNTAVIEGKEGFSDSIIIKVSDNSGHCPIEYQAAHPDWNGLGVYSKKL